MVEKKNVPEIRFEGFEKEWKEKKFADISDTFEYGLNAAATKYDGQNKYLRITDIDDNTRQLNKTELTSPNIDLCDADNYTLRKGDILFARTGASVGKSYLYKEEDGLVYFAGFLIRMRIKNEYDPNFIFINTLTDDYNNFVKFTSQRSGQPGINAQEYSGFRFKLPNFEEQQKIGNFFRHLDGLISHQELKLKKVTQLKAAMLDKMFPKEGSKIPEIRFKGFEGEWEIKKLDEVGHIINGLTYNPNDIREEGILVLRSSNIKSNSIVLDDCVYVRTDISGVNKIESNDILICVRNGSKDLIGKNAIIPDTLPFATHGAFMTVFRTRESSFVFQLFQTKIYNKQVKADLGATINSINGKNFIRYEFPIPKTVKEQQEIGSYFQKLDELIQLQGQKLEKLQQIKQALLSKMFVSSVS